MGKVIYVPGDQPSIQAGINATVDGDTVLVAEDIWYENINFRGKAIMVASHYILNGDTNHINNTVINGSQPSHPDSASVVTFASGEDTTSVICGFTIKGGTGTPFWDTYRVGGGIFCGNSDAKIIHNKIINNTVSSGFIALGGGVFCNRNYIILRNNIIRENSLVGINGSYGGGIYSYKTYYLEITGNIVTQNSNITGGAGVFCQNPDGPVTVSQNVISNNIGLQTSIGYGAGLNIDDAYDFPIVVNRNLFINNSSNNGGGLYEKNCFNLSLTNNVFIGNDAYVSGGAVFFYHEEGNDRPEIVNNTFSNNSAAFSGGAICYSSVFSGSSPVIMNCIFWKNSSSNGEDIHNWSGDTLPVYYSDIDIDIISGPWYGMNNFLADPEFIDDTCHLNCWSYSPCINAGISELVVDTDTIKAPHYDFDGDERPKDDYYDIGAFEETICTSVEEIFPPLSNQQIWVHPNPATDFLNISMDKELKIQEIIIYNVMGQKVRKEKPTYHRINVSSLSGGMYLLEIITRNERYIAKFIK